MPPGTPESVMFVFFLCTATMNGNQPLPLRSSCALRWRTEPLCHPLRLRIFWLSSWRNWSSIGFPKKTNKQIIFKILPLLYIVIYIYSYHYFYHNYHVVFDLSGLKILNNEPPENINYCSSPLVTLTNPHITQQSTLSRDKSSVSLAAVVISRGPMLKSPWLVIYIISAMEPMENTDSPYQLRNTKRFSKGQKRHEKTKETLSTNTWLTTSK